MQGLIGLVSGLLFRIHHVNSKELLNLSLLLVKIHDDGFVVCLSDAIDERVVLWHQDAIDGADCVGHVVKELAPHPVAVGAHCINIAVGVLSGRKIARLSCTTHEDEVGYGVHVQSVNRLFFRTTCENWEFFVAASRILESTLSHSGYQRTQDKGRLDKCLFCH